MQVKAIRNLLVTGCNGFIGKNFVVSAERRADLKLFGFSRGSDRTLLKQFIEEADAIVHFAGVNRPVHTSEFVSGNADLTEEICRTLITLRKNIPFVFASSTQALLENDYGRSKKLAEKHILQYSHTASARVGIFRLPNVFGKWGRPNYNSAVITFCYNIARGLPITINDRNASLRLVYVDDVVASICAFLDSSSFTGPFVEVQPTYETTVGEVADLIQTFAASRECLRVERVGEGLPRALYSTFLSYIPTDKFSYPIVNHADSRGSFVEMLKTKDSGQFSYFTSGPGITRGGHFHHTKVEKFLVVQGNAKFRFRNITTGEFCEIETNGDRATIVETIPGWAHDVTNIGNDTLVCMLWANEVFDPKNPDTFSCKVTE